MLIRGRNSFSYIYIRQNNQNSMYICSCAKSKLYCQCSPSGRCHSIMAYETMDKWHVQDGGWSYKECGWRLVRGF